MPGEKLYRRVTFHVYTALFDIEDSLAPLVEVTDYEMRDLPVLREILD